ncbi:MAG: FhaA domain-containing protein [Solirubrobacteraceae bacterium]
MSSIMRNLESKLAGLVEGAFGRAFRSEIKPVELARHLTREMDDHRTVSLNRTYVPTEYILWLSPADRGRYEQIEPDVCEELVAHLLEHARSEQLALASVPRIEFATDTRLALGECHAEARLVVAPAAPQAGEAAAEDWLVESPEPEPEPGPEPSGGTMIFSTADRLAGPLEQSPARAVVLVDDQPLLLGPHGAVLGRSRDCDVVLARAGVSRRHAQIAVSEYGWTIEDLGSTNGTRVNGRVLQAAQLLSDGDTIDLGGVRVGFELR